MFPFAFWDRIKLGLISFMKWQTCNDFVYHITSYNQQRTLILLFLCRGISKYNVVTNGATCSRQRNVQQGVKEQQSKCQMDIVWWRINLFVFWLDRPLDTSNGSDKGVKRGCPFICHTIHIDRQYGETDARNNSQFNFLIKFIEKASEFFIVNSENIPYFCVRTWK